MSLLKKIGTAVKNVGNKIATAVDNTAKKLSNSNSAILSVAGSLVDSIIPDKKVEEMAAAAKREGTTDVAKVEKTIQKAAAEKGVTDTSVINTIVHETAKSIAEETATTVKDEGASVKVTTWEKVKAFCKKYAKWLIAGGSALVLGLVAWLASRKGGKKKYRR
ncbi:MAG: hypothetical protein J6S11_08625 [Bacteroidaceae bacterium]|nr:hypothetical protein [Bacteroidaceae bacterium]